MPIPKFTTLVSSVFPLNRNNIDTDQIIPARFLTSTQREGFGAHLFCDTPYNIDNPYYKGSSILLAGANFGCGSSREHAAWAIADHGFRVVISTSFADIFRNNALNIGLLPVEVSPNFSKTLFDTIEKNGNKALVCVDLEMCLITNMTTGANERFSIDAFKKRCLLNGLDNVEYLLTLKEEIESFEKQHKQI